MTGRRLDRNVSDSFLVRCWKEPREVADEPDVMRLYVRNLRTGEEHYLNDPSQIGELVMRGLQQPSGRATEADDGRRYKVG